ncbi:twin transmembrane helix small protein [Pararhodobacter sp.]|uniref:twin transmembrane helix small protein n=1 Tax=Pararhodobacter sp. TaxID=2127056 RepID=UPI002AFE399C|nr:twin transmembrane helix small protein [Pararhodobacter sp.]
MLLNDPLFITAAVASLVVLAILMYGIGTFAGGKDPSGHKANKIMWWRIGAQFIVVILIVGFAYLRSGG